MMVHVTVLFDTSVFAVYLQPSVTAASVPDAYDRILYLVDEITARQDTIIVPEPVIAEALTVAAPDAMNPILERLDRTAFFRFAPFGRRAAIETAIMSREMRAWPKKNVKALGTRQKVKVDRQIIAIAAAEGVDTIYSDDPHFLKLTKKLKRPIEVRRFADMKVPPGQITFDLRDSNDNEDSDPDQNEKRD